MRTVIRSDIYRNENKRMCLVRVLPTRHTLYKCLHSGSRFLFHFVGDVPINIQGEGCSVVPYYWEKSAPDFVNILPTVAKNGLDS